MLVCVCCNYSHETTETLLCNRADISLYAQFFFSTVKYKARPFLDSFVMLGDANLKTIDFFSILYFFAYLRFIEGFLLLVFDKIY